jgi:WD40 repeat protein
VTEVDAATGKTLRTLMTAEGKFRGFQLSRHGERLGLVTADGGVAVYDVDSGKRLWEKSVVPNDKVERPQFGNSRTVTLEFSPDGRRLVAAGEGVPPVVLHADTGESFPKLADTDTVRAYAFRGCFTRDGRLLVLAGDEFTAKKTAGRFPNQPEQASWSATSRFLRVWDTDTGTLLKGWGQKGWEQAPSGVAFHPTRPVLAVVEPNGENTTRLGLWDFAAEAPRK